MNILLTGAFGNVGLSTLNELLNQGYYVRIFELQTKRNKHISKDYLHLDSVDVFWGDLRVYSDVLAAMRDKQVARGEVDDGSTTGEQRVGSIDTPAAT